MPLNFGNIFPPKNPVLESFNFIDLITGQGYASFYLLTAKDSTATSKKIISQSLIDSEETNTSVSDYVEQDYTKEGDFDFDIEMLKSQIIKGYVTGEFFLKLTTTNGFGKCYAIIRLRKYDGTTETEIGYAKTDILEAGSGSEDSKRVAFFIDVSSNVRIKRGELLRVTVEIWLWIDDTFNTSAAPRIVTFYHDPTNRNIFLGTSVTDSDTVGDITSNEYTSKFSGHRTDFKINIPFKTES